MGSNVRQYTSHPLTWHVRLFYYNTVFYYIRSFSRTFVHNTIEQYTFRYITPPLFVDLKTNENLNRMLNSNHNGSFRSAPCQFGIRVVFRARRLLLPRFVLHVYCTCTKQTNTETPTATFIIIALGPSLHI